MFFNEDHLRITKIRTADGLTPLYDSESRPLKKIVFAPNNALTKRLFNEENDRKPTPLKMKIELVKAYKPEAVVQPQVNDEVEKLKAELEKMKTEKAALEQQLSATPDKNHSTDTKPSANGNSAKQNVKHEAV